MHYLDPIIQEWHRLLPPCHDLHNILFWCFAGCLLIQLFYWWFYFIRLGAYRYKKVPPDTLVQPVSVIIAARDEYLNLRENLPSILEQEYPDFEVIVVNNDSTDDSTTLLKNFQLRYPHLNVIHIERNLNFFKGKKFPLSIGIKAAKHDILLFTDADCRPATPHWISNMQSAFTPETGIVLGIGQYARKSGLLNLLIRFETFFIAVQYLSFALAGMPYMGVGRNLAYRKSLFMKQKGFISHYKVSSGDDDLFVNEAAQTTRVDIMVLPESHTFSRPVSNLRRWFIQKRRHFTTARHYRPLHRFVLGLYVSTQLLTYSLLILLLFQRTFLILTIAAFLVRWISQVIVLKTSAKTTGINFFFLLSPLMEFALLLLHLMVAFVNLFSRPKKWK